MFDEPAGGGGPSTSSLRPGMGGGGAGSSSSLAKHKHNHNSKALTPSKASLTSHPMCTYVLLTEKNRLICKGHLSYTCDFITEFRGRRDLAMKIGMHIIFSVLTKWLQVHPYLKGNLQETWARAFSLLVLDVLPQLLKVFARAVRYTHMYLACV